MAGFVRRPNPVRPVRAGIAPSETHNNPKGTVMKLALRPFLALGIAGAVAALTLAPALADAISDRKEAMKTNGASMKVVVPMVKGEAPFDGDKAAAAMNAIAEVAATFADHFPEGSETGGETTAAPAIWENMDDFKARLVKFEADARAAAAATGDLEAFKAAFGPMSQNCGSCHEVYRIKK